MGTQMTTTSSSFYTTAGSQFKLPSMAGATRSSSASSHTVDLAFSLARTPRRGGAAVWKLAPEDEPEAPWELKKDEGMWVALTGLRSSMEAQKKREGVCARTSLMRMKAPILERKPANEGIMDTFSFARELLERTFRRRQARQLFPIPDSSSPEKVDEVAEEEEEKEMAATQIQAVVRGAIERRRRTVEEVEVAERLQESVHRASSAMVKPWRPGAELPVTNVDGLWESIKGGHISGQIFVIDFLAVIAASKTSGLDVDLSNTVLGNFSGTASPRDPRDVFPRQVALIVAMLNKNPRKHLDRGDLCRAIDSVDDPEGIFTPGYRDLGIADTTRMGLMVFRRTFECLATLMAIDECYIISHIVWHMTGDLEISKEMGTHIFRQMGMKPPNPMRLSYQDFLHICHLFRVELTSGRSILVNDTVQTLFDRALKHIPAAFERRRRRILHKKGADEYCDKHEKKKLVNGWTEVSILLQELFAALPEGMVLNPLQMCLACPQYVCMASCS